MICLAVHLGTAGCVSWDVCLSSNHFLKGCSPVFSFSSVRNGKPRKVQAMGYGPRTKTLANIIISYHIISYRILSYRIVSYRMRSIISSESFHIISYHIISSARFLSHHIEHGSKIFWTSARSDTFMYQIFLR